MLAENNNILPANSSIPINVNNRPAADVGESTMIRSDADKRLSAKLKAQVLSC
jgi:hypothetical protein